MRMKERSKVNMLTGMAYQLVNTLLGLVLPYLFITSLGSEANGLLSSITQLFVYLELLEAGVGGAAQQALYRPLAREDKGGINRILSAMSGYYQKTGGIYALLMTALAFAYPLLVDSQLPPETIIATILLQGSGSVVSYFFQAKYMVLLRAEGKVYFINGLMMASSILRNAGKILAIYLGFGILAVQTVQLLVVLLQGAVILFYIRRKYSWVDLKAEPDNEAISQKNAVLTQHIGWVIMNHSSVFLLTVVTRDLTLVSVFSLYTLVFEAVQNLMDVITNSYQYKLGQKAQVTRRELEAYYRRYERYFLAVSFALFATAYLLMRPFLRLYVGGVEDANYFLRWLPELFLLTKLINSVHNVSKQVVNVVGHFRKTQYIAIGETVVNLVVSGVLVFFLGIYGVLLGTAAALLYGALLYMRHVNVRVFGRGMLRDLGRTGVYTLVLALLCALLGRLGAAADTYWSLLLRGGLCGGLCLGVFLLLAFALNKKENSGGNDG